METQANKGLYVAEVTTLGGRNGHAQSSDNLLSVHLAFPKEIGGNGGATNPEQLFAAGFSACFGQSLSFVASQRKLPVDVRNVRVTTRVHLLAIEGGYGLAADLFIQVPGVSREQAEELVEATKTVCAYSNSTRGNVRTTYRVIEG
ncbi:organic hydroperoxide resistance protein [Larkinella soli]|uniref:organic hydroperoxide resistance protein n=1 Tax=Larkinella soli TaxID=1770527 RepID=UPI000FFCA8B3|nr:organic hydroperoxide resistance protein [Larkinella soli]